MRNTQTRTRNPNFFCQTRPEPDPKSKSPTRHGLIVTQVALSSFFCKKKTILSDFLFGGENSFAYRRRHPG